MTRLKTIFAIAVVTGLSALTAGCDDKPSNPPKGPTGLEGNASNPTPMNSQGMAQQPAATPNSTGPTGDGTIAPGTPEPQRSQGTTP